MASSSKGTPTLDALLASEETREVVLRCLAALKQGGGAVTAGIANKSERKRMEEALREFGARYSRRKGEVWLLKKSASSKRARVEEEEEGEREQARTGEGKQAEAVLMMPQGPSSSDSTIRKPSFGPAPIGPSVAKANAAQVENDDDEEEGPSLTNPRLPAPKPEASSSASEPQKEVTKRGEWMFQNVREDDPMRHLRHEAMTSQKGRSFNNHRTTVSSTSALPSVGESRAAATGKSNVSAVRAPAAGNATTSREPFKWNHEEMMGEERVDKNRLNQVLGEGVQSRFAPASRKFL